MSRISKMIHSTPLRYPGGKGKLSPFIKLCLQENNLLDGHYAEPYAGGAGVAIDLLLSECVSYIHLNDLNYPLYCFWHAILNDCDEFLDKLSRCTLSVAAWRRHRNIVDEAKFHRKVDVGFSFFFLNRTNRSGIISGGVIGGYEQTGNWKIDARFNKETLKNRIQRINAYADRIFIYNLDAIGFLKKMGKKLPSKSLIYLDPPYYDKGQRLYDNFYCPDDHVSVRNAVSEINDIPWIVSYDNKPAILDLYKRYRSHVYDLKYSAAKAYNGSEAIFFCDAMKVPDKRKLQSLLYKSAA